MNTYVRIISTLAVAASLAACGGGKSSLLGSKTAPDETYVVDGPSLVLPPNFSLRPPADGKMVEQTLQAPVAADPNDAWLLKNAGAVDKDIRKKLEEPAAGANAKVKAEAAEAAEDEKSPWWKPW
ncbi:MAG: hypothetical protein WAX89_07700 [Alphaproteobacteria bacterium]